MILRDFALLFLLGMMVGGLRGAEVSRPFVMPVKATEFEVRNQELLRMGESALNNRDYVAAVGYFHELRGKLSGEPQSSDYVLASSLLAESCLAFPPDSVVSLKGAQGRRLNVTEVIRGVLQGGLPQGLSPAVAVHRGYVRGFAHLKHGNYEASRREFMGLWGVDSRDRRLKRLGDLHNWTLLMYMQACAALAEFAKDAQEASGYWQQVSDLGLLRVFPLPNASSSVLSDQAKVTMQAGSSLVRSPRADVLEGEFLRLRANALIEQKEYGQAEAELKQTAMAIFPADRNLMLLSCIARQGRMDEAVSQFKRCEQEYGDKEAQGWRQALWSMFSMYYEAGMFDEAECHLVRLESQLRPEERYKWLMLRLVTLKGRLERLLRLSPSEGEARLVSSLDSLYNSCMKYSLLFPEACQPSWKEFIVTLKGEHRRSYFRGCTEMLYALGQASRRAGNVNSAIELFEHIGRSAEATDGLRYRSLMALGEISTSDIDGSIAAYKAAVELPGISTLQRADALFNASKRALRESARPGAPPSVKTAMGDEAERILKTLSGSPDYRGTASGCEASYLLADYLYGRGRYADASSYFESYFNSQESDVERANLARLLWSRCWRLEVEVAKQKTGALNQRLLQARELLTTLRAENVESELRAQAYLESYRIAFAMDDDATGLQLLEDLLALPRRPDQPYSDAFWIGLYERTLCFYQRNEFAEALKSGELFIRERESYRHEIPWEMEFWILLGDIHACRHEWKKGAEMYGMVRPRSNGMRSLLVDYGHYEQAYCLYMANDLEGAKTLLEEYFQKGKRISKDYQYRSAMLLGDVHLRLGEYLKAREHYVQAQGIYWQVDTFKASVAMCRQGEVFLMSADQAMRGGVEEMKKANAIGSLERASEIFGSLMMGGKGGSNASADEQDHYLDLLLRAQYRLGKCYELLMVHGEGQQQAKEARGNALWCYQRVCDYFIERARSGNPMKSASYYIKSLSCRVRLLTDTDDPVTHDTMELIARLYDEYAALGLSGSIIAKQKAEAIRKRWK